MDVCLRDFFASNGLTVESFDDVLIAGGVANCNLVYTYLQNTFPNTVIFLSFYHFQFFPELLTIYNPNNNANETVLVNGAAIQCACWMGVKPADLQSLLFIDLLPHDICIQTKKGYEVVIPKGVSIPTRKMIEVELEGNQKDLSLSVFRSKDNEFIVNERRVIDVQKLGEFEFVLNNIDIQNPSSVDLY